MFDGVLLLDRAYFSKPEWAGQARDGFTPGAAWVDFLGLANQARAGFMRRGQPVAVSRGQVGWSIKALHERWGRSQSWVAALLQRWAKEGRIRLDVCDEGQGTITTILNYEFYQDGMLRMLVQNPPKNTPETEPDRELSGNSAGTHQELGGTEKGEGRRDTEVQGREKGEGRREGGEPPPASFDLPSVEDVLAF